MEVCVCRGAVGYHTNPTRRFLTSFEHLAMKFLGFFACLITVSTTSALAQEKEFTTLFDGKSLDGWHGRAHNVSPTKFVEMSDEERETKVAQWQEDVALHWSVEDGELVNDGKGVYLATNKDYRDYELLLQYKTVPRADSGIYLKGTPQVQIWDYTDENKFKNGADKGSGGLWNNSPGAPGKDPLVLADKPFGEWNDVRIVQIGSRTSVWLNDRQVVDHAIMENYWNRESPLVNRGPIELQTHGGEIRWRNIKIREIEPEEASRWLSMRKHEFKKIFNGEDFTGWIGATDNYEIVDGAIRCKKGTGGNLLTAQAYADFVVAPRVPPPRRRQQRFGDSLARNRQPRLCRDV